MADPYLQGNGTLRNALGIAGKAALQKAEDEASLLRIQTLLHAAPGTTGDVGAASGWGLARLKAIHGHVFGGVYDWAGTTRAEPFVDTTSGERVATMLSLSKERSSFAPPTTIAMRMKALEKGIERAGGFKGMKRLDFIVGIADVLCELNEVHPFREGNGRTQRAFVTGLAREAGRDLDFSVITQERMIQASIAAGAGNREPMRRLVRDAGSPERVKELRKAQDALDRNGFDWRSQYVGFTEPGHELKGTLVGVVRTQYMMRHDETILVGRRADLPAGAKRSGTEVSVTPRGKPTARASSPLGRRGRDAGAGIA